MPFSPIPRGVYPSVTSLRPKDLADRGDPSGAGRPGQHPGPLQGDRAPPGRCGPGKTSWRRRASQLFLLSNSRKPGRAQNFAEKLDIPYQGHSGKPRKAGYLRAMERMGCHP